MSNRRAVFANHFLQDMEYWTRTDRKTAIRLLRLIREILKEPFGGIGKPEPLKRELAGLWSRRLTREHRVVYEVSNFNRSRRYRLPSDQGLAKFGKFLLKPPDCLHQLGKSVHQDVVPFPECGLHLG